MRNYSLLLSDDGLGVQKRIDFEAVDAGSALAVLGNERHGRRAELWQDNAFVCILQRDTDGGGFWTINPA